MLTHSQNSVKYITGYILEPDEAIMAGTHGYPVILIG